MTALACTPETIVGTFRTFGEDGPVYEVKAKSGATKVTVVVVATGEEFDYLLEHALNDPEAE